MRLLTLSTLRCPAKDVIKGYPLGIEIEDMKVNETECQPSFIAHVLQGIEWEAVCIAARAVGIQDVPNHFDNSLLKDGEFLKAMHNLLIDVDVVKGWLICPESGRRFPISNSVPNMMYVS